MTVQELLKLPFITPEYIVEDAEYSSVFCCDLLSVAMARAPEGSAWVTVMTNSNVVAVATLADVACVILAEGYSYDPAAIEAAKGKVTLLRSSLPIYETALQAGQLL